MKPDFNKINERMEQGSLNELMPGFDREQEWDKLHAKLHPQKKNATIWAYAAAIVLLLAGGAGVAIYLSGAPQQPLAALHTAAGRVDTSVYKMIDHDIADQVPVMKNNNKEHNVQVEHHKDIAAVKKNNTGHKLDLLTGHHAAKAIICNGTPCPLEICINQTMRCPNIEPATISSCSTLEPDHSGRLSYKAHDKIAKNCSLTVNEIEIKNIATGETILLTGSSTPSTAQDVFSYITGQRKGDILTGMFNSDCDHNTQKHDLMLNNSYGDLILQ